MRGFCPQGILFSGDSVLEPNTMHVFFFRLGNRCVAVVLSNSLQCWAKHTCDRIYGSPHGSTYKKSKLEQTILEVWLYTPYMFFLPLIVFLLFIYEGIWKYLNSFLHIETVTVAH